MGKTHITENRKTVSRKNRFRVVKLNAVVIAVFTLVSLALAYLLIDVFNEEATIVVLSFGYPDDIQYEIYNSVTEVMLANGTLASNGSETHKFDGFDRVAIVFRSDVWQQDFICPYLLSDGQKLFITLSYIGVVHFQLKD